VSDRARALINLAQEKYKVKSIADLFHLKHCINKLLTLSLNRKLEAAQKNLEAAQKGQKENLSNTVECEELAYGEIQFYTDLYVESVQNISHCVHAFENGNCPNTAENAKKEIENELENIKQVVNDCEITDNYNLLEKAENQVADSVEVINLWHEIVVKELSNKNMDVALKTWFEKVLLPQTYWNLFIKKTKHKPTLERLKKELNLCKEKEKEAEKYEFKSEQELQEIKDLAIELCNKFQRSSSQVEGRNGYLSMINHTQRGFDTKRIEVLTVVHNFDIKGIDEKTPAQRLFKNQIEHTSIFEYILNNTNELAIPRNRQNKVTDYHTCPTLCG